MQMTNIEILDSCTKSLAIFLYYFITWYNVLLILISAEELQMNKPLSSSTRTVSTLNQLLVCSTVMYLHVKTLSLLD